MWLWWPWRHVTQLSCFREHAWLCTQLSPYWINSVHPKAQISNELLPADDSTGENSNTGYFTKCGTPWWATVAWGLYIGMFIMLMFIIRYILSWEDTLEEGMATHSRILAWRIPWTEKPGGLQSMGSQRFGYDWAIKHSTAYIKLVYYITK